MICALALWKRNERPSRLVIIRGSLPWLWHRLDISILHNWWRGRCRGLKNLAAHRRSHLLSRSRGILLITQSSGFLVAPGLRPQRARASKGPTGNQRPGLCAGADRPAPDSPRIPNSPTTLSGPASGLLVGLIMAGLFTGKRTGRSASWEHVRIGSSIL